MQRLFGAKNTAPKPSLQGAINNLDSRIESIDVKLAKINAELTTYQQKISKMRDGPGKTALKQRALKVLQQRKMYEGQRDQLQQQSWNMEQAGMMQDNLKSHYRPTYATTFTSAFSLPLSSLSFRILFYTAMLLPPILSLWVVAVVAFILPLLRLPWVVCVLISAWRDIWGGNGPSLSDGDGNADVMVTVDAMKSTQKELKKQYGKISIDKIEKLQDEMADLMDLGNEMQAAISRTYDIPEDVDEAELDAELEALGEEVELGVGWEVDTTGPESLPAFLQDEPALPSFLEEPGKEAGKKVSETAS